MRRRPGVEPELENAVDVLDGTLTRFDTFDLTELGAKLWWDTSKIYTHGAIAVIPEPTRLALRALVVTRLQPNKLRLAVGYAGPGIDGCGRGVAVTQLPLQKQKVVALGI